MHIKRLNALKGFWEKSKGAALVELVLIIPVLFYFFAGVVNFGYLAVQYVHLNSAMNAGFSYAISNPSNLANVPAVMKTAINNNAITVTTTQFCRCSNGTQPGCSTKCSDNILPGSYVTLTAQMTISFIIPNFILSSPYTVTETITFRIA